MRRKLNHPYGYKVGYREIGSRLFIRQFITRTHRQAHRTLLFYRKYGHASCRKKDIEKFNYSLKPITRKEFLAGIWDEIPFPRHQAFFAFLAGQFCISFAKLYHAHQELKYRLKFKC